MSSPNFSTWPDVRAARAIERVVTLNQRLMDWNALQLFTCSIESAPDSMSADIVLHVAGQPPLEEFSILLSEAIHHMRGALDSLTWEMCRLGGPPLHPTNVMFPAAMKPEDWSGRAGNLAPMPEPFLSRVRDLQPYSNADPEKDGMGVLIRLSNFDKHRGQLEAGVNIGLTNRIGIHTGGQTGGMRVVPLADAALIDGLHVQRLEFDFPITISGAEVRVSINWEVEDEAYSQRYNYDSIVIMARSLPLMLHYLRTGEGDLEPGTVLH